MGNGYCHLPVDGNPEEVTSYRTELHTILFGFILLLRLIPSSLQNTTKCKLWTDSKSYTDKLFTTRQVPFSNMESLSKDSPILSEINKIREMFPGVELNWLASHQKIMRFEQDLNSEEDRVTETQHECSGEWDNTNNR